MKKVFLLFCLFFILSVYGFSQNNLTQDQIRRHANELGVPYDALQRLVDSHRVQTGLSNPNANGAQFFSVEELDFMAASDMLEIGSFYRTRAKFYWRDGRTIMFVSPPNENSGGISIEMDSLVNIPQNTILDVLFGVRASSWGGKERFLVEIAVAR